MKTLFFLLAVLGTACQPQAAPGAATAAHGAPTASAASPALAILKGAASLPSPFKAADTLTVPMRQRLSQYDLSQLWQGATEGRGSCHVLEGFFGPDHYRFELVMSEVHRDNQNPGLYHVRGKCHYRKNIRPFTGALVIHEVSDFEGPYEFDYKDKDAPNQSESTESDSAHSVYEQKLRRARPSEVRAELRIKEDDAANSGEMVGEATLLFYLNSHNRPAYLLAPIRGTDSFTNAGYLLIRGTRYNVTTHQVKQFVVADNVFTAAPDVLKDFDIGDRGGEMNPKYAHLGWNEKWENKEWWADSPKPSLNL